MSKIRRFQFGMSSLVLLMTVACVGVGIYGTWKPTVEVLVATEHLDHKTAITKANVKFETWPTNIVPEGAITSSDGIPTGDVIVTRLRKGQVLIDEDVVDPATILWSHIPPGYRIINISFPTYEGSCALLVPGDRVDVVANSGGNDESQTRICKDVRIFNIGSSTSGSGMFAIVGLLLTEDQAAAVTDAKAVGEVRLTLRGDNSSLD